MSLIEKIQKDLITAAKAKKDVEADILRVVLSSLKNAVIAKGPESKMSDQEEIKVVFGEAKKIKDSIVQYEKGGRTDLAEREKIQLSVVEKYLPKQAEAGDIGKAVEKAIEETGASSIKDLGKVMGAVMKALQGKADGAVVNQAVKEKLSEKEAAE